MGLNITLITLNTVHKLDQQLEAGLHGNFSLGWKLAEEMAMEVPVDPRSNFNRGWYEMHRGNHLAGAKLLDTGRDGQVFGNKHIGSGQPIWNGERGVTVLMEMEGGLGDQIHAIRYAKAIADYGNKVVISGCRYLADVMIDCEGVSAFCQHEVATGVYHDYWLPSMSAVIPLKYEWSDLSGESYIRRTKKSEGKVGVRWSGILCLSMSNIDCSQVN